MRPGQNRWGRFLHQRAAVYAAETRWQEQPFWQRRLARSGPATMLPAFSFEVRLVVPIEDAVRSELEMMDWRDKLKFD